MEKYVFREPIGVRYRQFEYKIEITVWYITLLLSQERSSSWIKWWMHLVNNWTPIDLAEIVMYWSWFSFTCSSSWQTALGVGIRDSAPMSTCLPFPQPTIPLDPNFRYKGNIRGATYCIFSFYLKFIFQIFPCVS